MVNKPSPYTESRKSLKKGNYISYFNNRHVLKITGVSSSHVEITHQQFESDPASGNRTLISEKTHQFTLAPGGKIKILRQANGENKTPCIAIPSEMISREQGALQLNEDLSVTYTDIGRNKPMLYDNSDAIPWDEIIVNDKSRGYRNHI